jgi:hypothetical protein
LPFSLSWIFSADDEQAEWLLLAAGLLGFGLAALGHYVIGQRWLTGAGFLVAAVVCIALVVLAQQRPPR